MAFGSRASHEIQLLTMDTMTASSSGLRCAGFSCSAEAPDTITADAAIPRALSGLRGRRYNVTMNSPLDEALQELRLTPRFSERITAWKRLPARAGRYAPVPSGLQPALIEALAKRGIGQLYTHQAQAIAATLGGNDVVVVTGAASGKTLCYNLPVLSAMLSEPDAHALYLFPTKALAQDQLAAWQDLSAELLPASTGAVYDGDTPSAQRSTIRRTARVLLTNPDMLHMGILPHHTRWRDLLAGLNYIVLDELHSYRGIFGSHVANVLRRLERICAFYGSFPTFICCSATITNPQQLASQLTGRAVALVDDDASPHGERHVILYNPPVVDVTHGVRRSLILEAASVAHLFLSRELPTIVFSRGRLSTELLLTYLRRADGNPRQAQKRIRGYRGGYLPRQRRSIERGLREGQVLGVVSTNALELGVDIGDLSVCVLAGYPGSIASTWQQAGRAGRRQDESVAVLVGGPSALDQYLLSHTEFLFGRSPERALVAPDNPFLLQSHLKCAAFELPIADEEPLIASDEARALLAQIDADEGVLRHTGQRWYWMSSHYAAQDVSLRTASGDRFTVVNALSGQAIGQVDAPSAPIMVYPGAIYLHEGQSYLVQELNWDDRKAGVVPSDAQYFTDVRVSVKVEVQQQQALAKAGRIWRAQGDVCVRSQPTHFQKIAWYTHEVLDTVLLDLTEQELDTTAYWLYLRGDVVLELRDQGDWTIAPIMSYGPNWAAQRQRARERDGFRCRLCGRTEEGREHDVHHMRPFRTFDYRAGRNANYIMANALPNLITLCPDCHRRVEAAQAVQGTLDGLANLLRALAPLYVMCDAHDIAVTSDLDFAETRSPTVIVYDTVPGGVGLSAALYELHDELLQACLDWVRRCPCEEGCPACVGAPPQIGAGAKQRVEQLLERVVTPTEAA
jgi:DEAD/DEAH box helicase domain-containing protein